MPPWYAKPITDWNQINPYFPNTIDVRNKINGYMNEAFLESMDDKEQLKRDIIKANKKTAKSMGDDYNPDKHGLKIKEKPLTVSINRITDAPFEDEDYATIAHLKTKAEEWITNNKVMAPYLNMIGEPRYAHNANIIFAGGFFASHILGDPVQDMDIFIMNCTPESGPKDADWEVQSQEGYHNNQLILKVFNYVGPKTFVGGKPQIMTTSCTTRKEITDYFDYEHCRISYEVLTKKLFVSKNVLTLIRDRKLVANPGRTISAQREQKYIDRGWSY